MQTEPPPATEGSGALPATAVRAYDAQVRRERGPARRSRQQRIANRKEGAAGRGRVAATGLDPLVPGPGTSAPESSPGWHAVRYAALIECEDDRVVADFPDCKYCRADAAATEEIVDVARTVLEGWLRDCLGGGELPPKPSVACVTRDWFEWVEVAPELSTKLQLCWARSAAGLSQRDLALRAGVAERDVVLLEKPDAPLGGDALRRVAQVLDVPLPPAARRPTARRRPS